MAKTGKKGKTGGKGKSKGGGGAFAGVSLNPESFVQMGLPDDFDAVASEPGYILYDFPNKEGQATTDKYRVCARFHVEPDEESGIEPFDQVYSVASSEYWVPANVVDGELVPVDVDEWDGEDYDETFGTHIMPNDALIERLERSGKAATLPKGTNFDFFLGKLGETGFADWPTDGSLGFLDGMSAHFDRVRGPERDFGDAQKKGKGDILVITAIHGTAKAAGGGGGGGKKATKVSGKKAGKASSGKSGKAAKGGGDEEVRAKLEAIIAAILTEKPMTRKKVITKVIQGGELGNKEKRVALGLLADSNEFMGEDERPWSHDEDDDTFWLGGEIEEDEEEDEELEEEGDTDEDEEEEDEDEEDEDED